MSDKKEIAACKAWWNDHEPEHLKGADFLSALSAWMERAKREVPESEWQHRAEMLRVKLGECQTFLEKAVSDGKKHVARAERAEDELRAHPRTSVLAGLALAKEHLEAQKNVWSGTQISPEALLDTLLKNMGALQQLVLEGKLPEKK